PSVWSPGHGPRVRESTPGCDRATPGARNPKRWNARPARANRHRACGVPLQTPCKGAETMSPSRVVARLLLLACLTFPRPAHTAEEPSADRTLSPYFYVEGGDDGVDRLPLLGTSVQVDIAGVIAHVTVRQSYKNDGARPIHARYVFPASTRAAVHGLTMTVGEERVVAKIREREQARVEFAQAKKAGKNAAL